jgi:hypothetical protein
MGDSMQLFGTLMRAFCQSIPRAIFRDIRRLVVLAWAVVGLCLGKTVCIDAWGESMIDHAQYASSRQRRFRRWLHNPRVRPVKFYFPLLLAALRDWPSDEKLYLALDTSDLHNGYILIRLSLVYRGRAVPIAWRVIQHNSASVSYRDYKGLLHMALLVLPSGCPVILLADRGFVHAELVKFARDHHWGYRLRAKSNTQVCLSDGRLVSMAEICPSKGHAHFYWNVHVLGEGIGPVHIALANPKSTKEEPWYIISDEVTTVATLDEYALRFNIEEEFLDNKSNGFQVESSKLDDPRAIDRLFLIIAVATLHFTCVGAEVVRRKCRRWIDSHWDRGMSYLKIGWKWLRQQYRRRWPVLPPFRLDPGPDPEPAIASRRQVATRLPRCWVVARFGGLQC